MEVLPVPMRWLHLLAVLLVVLLVQDSLVWGKPPSRLKNCPTLRLQNGMVRLRSKGRVARFTCNIGFKPFGDKTATCVGGHWEGSVPICVKGGCLKVAPPRNGLLVPFVGGALLGFICNSGYRLTGTPFLYCNGVRWNGTTPTCDVENTDPELSCDFENEGLCGWRQNPQNTIDWTRHRFATPSGHVGTGPSHDHTRGQGKDGYYMYIETSGRRALNGTARLLSPVYPSEASEDACFIFWYHMYGATSGSLNVYQKSEGMNLSSLPPLFTKDGDQGDLWFKALVQLKVTDKPFQVVVEGVPGRGYLGDTAIDDVLLTNGSDCLEPVKDITVVTSDVGSGGDPHLYDDAQSCRHRCSTGPAPPAAAAPDNSSLETPVMVLCECHVACMENLTCCPDYSSYCVLAKVTSPPVVPTLEYRTIATIHYIPSLLPRPTLPKPPPLPPLPPKPTEMTSSSSTNTSDIVTNLPTGKTTFTDQQRTSLDVERSSPVIPTTIQPELGVSSSTNLITNLDDGNVENRSFSSSVVITVQDFGSSEVPSWTERSPNIEAEQTSPKAETGIDDLNVIFSTETATDENFPTAATKFTTDQQQAIISTETTTTMSFDINHRKPTSPPPVPMTTPENTTPLRKYTTHQPRTTTTTRARTEAATTTKKTYPPEKKPFFTKRTSTPKPVTQRWTSKSTAKDKHMFYPEKDAETNYILKKEHLDPKRISGKIRQQPQIAAQELKSSGASTTIGIVGGIALLLVAFGIVAFAVVRRRRVTAGRKDLSDDSDVRFLTADEVLDFNIARPPDEDSGL